MIFMGLDSEKIILYCICNSKWRMNMKQLTILVILMCYAAWGVTIDLRDWEPEFKYKSEDLYSIEEANAYCEDKDQCVARYEENSREARIYYKVINCKKILTGKADRYIARTHQIFELVNFCGDGKLYEAKKIEEYEQPLEYIWKIEKKTKHLKVKLIENK